MERVLGQPDQSILKFNRICKQNGLELDGEKLEKLRNYVSLLVEWNSKINLISRNDTANVWFSHILHSISALFLVSIQPELNVLDLGTGGGLPGIPISIVRPDLKLTLLDSIGKKTKALQDMVERLDLTNVRILTGRSEELSRGQFQEKFDLILSRAVAPLADLINWSRPLARRNHISFSNEPETKRHVSLPSLVTLKGGDLQDEIKAAKIKTKPKNIAVINLIFEGSEEIGLEDKKIVIVNL